MNVDELPRTFFLIIFNHLYYEDQESFINMSRTNRRINTISLSFLKQRTNYFLSMQVLNQRTQNMLQTKIRKYMESQLNMVSKLELTEKYQKKNIQIEARIKKVSMELKRVELISEKIYNRSNLK